ncbi:MAG: hypothetical protein K2X90_04315 [Candidatus Babeliaceae bacterium]|nr:hypothetical protein [Candidatus Babeliaceae bacterium]
MKKIINSLVVASSITFLPAVPLKADLSVVLVANETGEDITLECGNYSLPIPAGQRKYPLRFMVPNAADYSAPMPSVGNEINRTFFCLMGADLICENTSSSACYVVLKKMDIAHSAGLLIRVTPKGVVFRLLADFEKSGTGVVYV